VTEIESVVEPNGVADDIGRESVVFVSVHPQIIDQWQLTGQYRPRWSTRCTTRPGGAFGACRSTSPDDQRNRDTQQFVSQFLQETIRSKMKKLVGVLIYRFRA
jgi:hypothetical protein